MLRNMLLIGRNLTKIILETILIIYQPILFNEKNIGLHHHQQNPTKISK